MIITLKQLHKDFNGTCQFCYEKVPLKNSSEYMDYTIGNVLICKKCNSFKLKDQYKILDKTPIKPPSLFPDIKALVKENKELKKKIKALEWSLYHAD